MKRINKVTNIYKMGGVKFHRSGSERTHLNTYKSKRTTAQLLALLFAFLLPLTSLFFACVNDIPGYNEADDYSTRHNNDTTAQDTIDGYDGTISPWDDTIYIKPGTIYEVDPEDLDEDVYDYFFGDDENE